MNTHTKHKDKAWEIIESTARELGRTPDSLITSFSGGNLAGLVIAAKTAARKPSDASDENYDLWNSVKAIGE